MINCSQSFIKINANFLYRRNIIKYYIDFTYWSFLRLQFRGRWFFAWDLWWIERDLNLFFIFYPYWFSITRVCVCLSFYWIIEFMMWLSAWPMTLFHQIYFKNKNNHKYFTYININRERRKERKKKHKTVVEMKCDYCSYRFSITIQYVKFN